MPSPSIPFVDLQAQFKRLQPAIEAAMQRVLAHGQFIMGPEVEWLEQELGEFCGAEQVISAASGSDALLMALMAYRVGPGDAVIVPTFTFVATAEMVQLLGATPVFVDVAADTFNLNVDALEQTIQHFKRTERAQLKGIIPVDLFGLPADYDAIRPVAAAHGLFVLADSAQSFGAQYGQRHAGTFGDISATSFFPAKPLGCYGDGGAVFTDDAQLADILKSIRFHGQGEHPYDNVRIGLTGRLDTLQAAVLRCKLKVFAEELAARQRLAEVYTSELSSRLDTPHIAAGYKTSWAQYTLRSPRRAAIRAHLQAQGIASAIYYPCPLHQQPAYRRAAPPRLPVAEALSQQVFSLPIHAYLSETDQARIIAALKQVI